MTLESPEASLQSQGYGGGDGSYENPYSEAEYDLITSAGYFTGGYVDFDGEVFWCLAPAYCDGTNGPTPGSNWVNILASYSSASFTATGQMAEQSPWTVRFTNSAGHVDFRCYTTGWTGNQYVNTLQPFGAGRILRVSRVGELLSRIGGALGIVNIAGDLLQLTSSQSSQETWSAFIDLTADTIFFLAGPYSVPLAILYTAGLGEQIKALILDCME